MMKLLDIKIINAVVILFVVKYINGEQQFVEFDYYYSILFRTKFRNYIVSESYEVWFTADRILTKHPEQENKMMDAEQTIQVYCKLFLLFSEKEGIQTCQDDNGKYYLITSKPVFHDWTANYYGWRVSCDDLLARIIEGEEVKIQCQVKVATDAPTYPAKITIGWIQGQHNITESYNLQHTTTNINQTFFGFNSGEGIFFYCHQTIIIRCYTLILKVLPQLNVNIISLYGTPESFGQRCFQCQATGGAGEKVYNWNLHNSTMTLKDLKHRINICLENLTAGVYTIECLVSTNAQNRSDVIEFTVEDDIPTEIRTTKQTATQQDDEDDITKCFMQTKTNPQTAFEKDGNGNQKSNKIYKIIVITLASIMTISLIVNFTLVYLLKQANNSKYKVNNVHTTVITKTPRNQQTETEDEAIFLDIVDINKVQSSTSKKQETGDTLNETQNTKTDDNIVYHDIKDIGEEQLSVTRKRPALNTFQKDTQHSQTEDEIIYYEVGDYGETSKSEQNVMETLKMINSPQSTKNQKEIKNVNEQTIVFMNDLYNTF